MGNAFFVWRHHAFRCSKSIRSLVNVFIALIALSTSLCILANSLFQALQDQWASAIIVANTFSTCFLLLKIVSCLLLTYIFMPAQLISTAYMPEIARMRAKFLSEFQLLFSPEGWRAIPTTIAGDGGALEAIEIHPPSFTKTSPEQRNWLISFCANGTCMDDDIQVLSSICRETGFAGLAINYRGVGLSEGRVHSMQDLINDGCSAMTHLTKNHSGHPSHIALTGHSIGGAVATSVRARFPGGPVVSNRSFSSLRRVVSCKLDILPLTVIVCSVLCAVVASVTTCVLWNSGVSLHPVGIFYMQVSFVIWIVVMAKGQSESDSAQLGPKEWGALLVLSSLSLGLMLAELYPISGFFGLAMLCFEMAVGGATLGFVLAILGVMKLPILFLLSLLEWDVDVQAAWEKCKSGKRAIIYHGGDQMIPYHTSLHVIAPSDVDLELTGQGDAHMYRLDKHKAEWGAAIQLYKSLFEIEERGISKPSLL